MCAVQVLFIFIKKATNTGIMVHQIHKDYFPSEQAFWVTTNDNVCTSLVSLSLSRRNVHQAVLQVCQDDGDDRFFSLFFWFFLKNFNFIHYVKFSQNSYFHLTT